jgi:hypothetical protein
MHETERRHIRQRQRSGAQPGTIAGASGTELGDMTERIGTFVAIGGGIARATDAEGIQNEEESTRHFSPRTKQRRLAEQIRRSRNCAKPYNGGTGLANSRS